MRRLRFHTADVFTNRTFGGNPLAVFPDARDLPPEDMQSIARELNLSETVFVLPPEHPAHTRRLRIFTPAAELPFAGHPTLGTAHVLAALGKLTFGGIPGAIPDGFIRLVFEEGVGAIPVTVRFEAGSPVFAQLSTAVLPEIRPLEISPPNCASVVSLSSEDVVDAEAASCGFPFTLIELASREALGRARLDSTLWATLLTDSWGPDVFLFYREPDGSSPESGSSPEPGCVHARMFAPSLNISEDPATGGGAAALAGYLGKRSSIPTGTFSWTILQGEDMGRPSRLELEFDKEDGEVSAVRVGGASVLVCEGTMTIPRMGLLR